MSFESPPSPKGRALGDLRDDVARSEAVASELRRHSANADDGYIRDQLMFIAGRLPSSETRPQDVVRALGEAMLMSRLAEDELTDLTVRAFSEARFA